MKKVLRRTLLVILMVALVLLILVSLREPSLSRTWDEDVSVLAGVEVSNDQVVTLTQVRDWSYAINSISSKEYFDAPFDPKDIVAMWMYEQQLDSSGLVAHTFLVFEFDESYERGRYLGLSVETRREQYLDYPLSAAWLLPTD